MEEQAAGHEVADELDRCAAQTDTLRAPGGQVRLETEKISQERIILIRKVPP